MSENLGSPKEMISVLRFLFENYKTHSWYWELVEMSLKVILTSGLILVGQESRSYIGLAWVIAGLYGVLFSWMKPIKDGVDNRLMSMSLAVTVVNLGIGAVSRIPAENLSPSTNPYTDAVLSKILVLGVNTLVIGLLFGKISFLKQIYLLYDLIQGFKPFLIGRQLTRHIPCFPWGEILNSVSDAIKRALGLW